MNPSYFQQGHLSFSSSFPQRPAVAGHGGARRPDTGVWPCTLDGCSKVFAREADLKRHQRTTKSHSIPGSSTGSPCPLCDATFTRSDAMRRHLKSRHGGKTPETLTQADVAAAAAAAASPGSRGKRRATSPQEDEESGSEGEGQGQGQGRSHQHHRTTASTSRAPSAAPPYYNPHQHPNHAPPPNVPPPQHPGAGVNNNLSPAILYQAAMSYEIRHALSPRASSSTASSPTMTPAVPVPTHAPPPPPPHHTTQPPSHHTAPTNSRRGDHQYPQPPMAPGYQQFPPDDYYGGPSSGPSGPPFPPYEPPQTYTTSSGASSYSGYSRTPYVAPPAQAQNSRTYPAGGGGKDSGGLQALAMHAAQIRPMSPLASKGGHSQGQGKTKSELESALGVPYGR